jgi:hypothetical protein
VSLEIAEKVEDVAFDAEFPVRTCESFQKPLFVRLDGRPVQSVQELVAAAKQQNEPSFIPGYDGVRVLTEMGRASTFGSSQIRAPARYHSKQGLKDENFCL